MKLTAVTLVLLAPALLAAQQQTGASGGSIPIPLPPNPAAPTLQTPAAAVFRIRVVDGRNRSPMQGVHLLVWYDETTGSGTLLTTDSNGVAALPAPLAEPIRVLVRFEDVIDCRRHASDEVPVGFNLQKIAVSGQSGDNTCGSFAVHTRPGELVLFARKPRWYEQVNRNMQQ